MAASSAAQHLDAFAGRDVVYCHSCQNEWFQDEHGLQCPRCSSEATEIVEPDSDPRDIHDDEPSPPPLPPFGGFHEFHHGHDEDSDPEEADIEEQVRQGPGGFYMRRTIYRSPSQPPEGNASRSGERPPADPQDGDAILRRFTDMLMHDFRVGTAGRSGPDTLYPEEEGEFMFGGRAPHVHRTTFRGPGFSGGTTTFTIATGPITRGPGSPSNAPPGMDFDTVFGNIMGGGNVPPPDPNRAGGAAPPLPGFAASLHEILASLMNPANAVHGDAVYSQEALDRIITSLMEANPQSNAAPPATQGAIERLEKKKLDAQMMGSDDKAECTICIDEIHLGDEVTVLPCKHWFHGDCVVLWLKEHNTCPICRHPVEGGSGNSNANPNIPNQPPQPSAAPSGPWVPPPSSPPLEFTSFRRRERPTRGPAENQERLDAIRNAAGGPPASWRSTPPRPRHGSLSPPSPRGDGRSATSSRTRLRSPSASSRDRDRERERYPHRYESSSSQRNSSGEDGSGGTGGHGGGGGHGPFSWFRDAFSRNSGSGSGSGSSNNGRRRS